MINFSFIIPHKNLPSFMLRRCLDSIPHRDDVQIIIIDDNSDPSIVDFSNFPGMNEKCTEVIFDKTGKGPGYARNIGLVKAIGKWILFADADDSFNIDNLSNAFSLLENREDIDIVYFGITIVDIKGNTKNDLYGLEGNKKITIFDNKESLIKDQHQSWRKVIRHSFIKDNHLCFAEICYCEDQGFSVRAIINSNIIGVIPSPIYNYIHRKTSITKSLEYQRIKEAFFDSISTNKYIKENKYSGHLIVTPYLLGLIKQESYVRFLLFIVYELLILGPILAVDDYTNACRQTNSQSNPIRALVHQLRVKGGAFFNKFKTQK